MDNETEEEGLLGNYGVLIVPPSGEWGHWFVTLAARDQETDGYVSSIDGPIVETRDEAQEEANKVLAWLQTQSYDGDLMRVWEQMQKEVSEDAGLGQEWPRHRWPWGI